MQCTDTAANTQQPRTSLVLNRYHATCIPRVPLWTLMVELATEGWPTMAVGAAKTAYALSALGQWGNEAMRQCNVRCSAGMPAYAPSGFSHPLSKSANAQNQYIWHTDSHCADLGPVRMMGDRLWLEYWHLIPWLEPVIIIVYYVAKWTYLCFGTQTQKHIIAEQAKLKQSEATHRHSKQSNEYNIQQNNQTGRNETNFNSSTLYREASKNVV